MSPVSRGTAAGRAYLDLQRGAKGQGRTFAELLSLYALEGFLDRLASSSHANELVLKGGVLLAAFGTRRPTRDVDLQAQELSNDPQAVLALVRSIAALTKDDGLVYDVDGATSETIREGDVYSGVRISIVCTLATARVPFHVDVNVGDPVWPTPATVDIPRLLGGTISLRGYPITMVLAEKVMTALQRGTVNTRWRDFADIHLLTGLHDVDGDDLLRSLDVVAAYRAVNISPLAMVLDGYADIGQRKWALWVRRQNLTDRLPLEFRTVVDAVATFADPALRGEVAVHTWTSPSRAWVSQRNVRPA